jgi:Ca2+-binding EF-hand superfamily protein
MQHTKLSDKMYERYVSSQFHLADKNGDNRISFDEFLVLYDKLYNSKEIPIGIKEKEKKSFVEKPDINAPKVVQRTVSLTDDQINDARLKFEKYDLDKNGHIDLNEMKKIVQDTIAGKNTSQMMVNRLATMNLNEVDKNGDGQITFEEFLKIYSKLFE